MKKGLVGFLLLFLIVNSSCADVYDGLRNHFEEPTIENLVTLFMAALNTRTRGQRRNFMKALLDSDRPSEEEIRFLFKEALKKVVKAQLDQLMTALPKEEVILHEQEAPPVFDDVSEAAIKKHITLAKSALSIDAETPDELLFALSAVGYLAGLLDVPHTRDLVGMTRKQLNGVEHSIMQQIERSQSPYVDLKMANENNVREPGMDIVKDTLEVKERTVIETDGTRIRTKKIKHVQVSDR